MTEESRGEKADGMLTSVEGVVVPDDHMDSKPSSSKPDLSAPELAQEVSTFMAQFRSGPDPAVASILAETERHAEDNNLAGYRATLEQRDRDSQRNQEFRLEQLKQSSHERRVVLYCCLAALAIGGVLSVEGKSEFGNPIMSAALTLLITLVSGKLKIGD
jgi:hypothetical protein